MLDLVLKKTLSHSPVGESFFVAIVVRAMRKLGWSRSTVHVGVIIVGDRRIRALNKRYRNVNKVTDVLSFPLQKNISKKPSSDLDLGDIFICLPQAYRYAKEEGVSIKDKLAWLTVHGFLHLAGYDHEQSLKAAKEMTVLESAILGK